MTQSPLEVRFWNKINKAGPVHPYRPELGPCWVWTGKTNKCGYGIIRDPSTLKELRAHRLSWEIHNGAIPDGMLVCHSCDVPQCQRISHLFLGTKKDNAQDALVKGRFHQQLVNLKQQSQAQVENPIPQKLTAEQVLEMRRIYIPGNFGTHRLAKMFGVCQQTAHDIVTRKIWKQI